MDHPIYTRILDLGLINTKKRIIVVPEDYGVKVQEGKEMNNYLDLAREQ